MNSTIKVFVIKLLLNDTNIFAMQSVHAFSARVLFFIECIINSRCQSLNSYYLGPLLFAIQRVRIVLSAIFLGLQEE